MSVTPSVTPAVTPLLTTFVQPLVTLLQTRPDKYLRAGRSFGRLFGGFSVQDFDRIRHYLTREGHEMSTENDAKTALPADLTTTDSIRCYRDDHALYREVLEARRKAHAKHGYNSIEVEPAISPRWLAILVEEIGETANALTYDGPTGNLRAELVDVLAVASAWVAAIDRDAEQATA